MRKTRLLAVVVAAAFLPLPSGQADEPPQTGFEQRDGADWTTHEEEIAFLAAIAATSDRVRINTVGRTAQDRPIQLVQLGEPAPSAAWTARTRPTVLFSCTQHGNEPAGREACLKKIRDLAFATDADSLALLQSTTVLFVPTMNPDGRATNTRGNSDGTDINRDHLNLGSAEAAAFSEVVRDWEPELVMDLHEYGPSEPVLYDDDVLYMWPRNLNVDGQVHDQGEAFALETVKPCAEEAGYTADEYGMQAVGDTDVQQTAGDADEGIMRNTMGLRHSVGILVETRVDMDPLLDPMELIDASAVNRRRVASHDVVVTCTLNYVRFNGASLVDITTGAVERKIAEGRDRSSPVYFGGADNTEPTPEQIQDPPPCGYGISSTDRASMSDVFAGLDIATTTNEDGAVVPMGQRAEPLIPLLLDGRGARHSIEATPLDSCPAAAAEAEPVPAPPPAPRPAPAQPLAATGGDGDLGALGACVLLCAALVRRLRTA